MTLVEFLLARIAEDEAVAKRGPYPEPSLRLENVETDESMFIAIDPARVLAECEAKRRIVEVYQQGEVWPVLTLRAIAHPYRDHPDYDPEWAL